MRVLGSDVLVRGYTMDTNNVYINVSKANLDKIVLTIFNKLIPIIELEKKTSYPINSSVWTTFMGKKTNNDVLETLLIELIEAIYFTNCISVYYSLKKLKPNSVMIENANTWNHISCSMLDLDKELYLKRLTYAMIRIKTLLKYEIKRYWQRKMFAALVAEDLETSNYL